MKLAFLTKINMTEHAFSVTIQNYSSRLKTSGWISAQMPRWLLRLRPISTKSFNRVHGGFSTSKQFLMAIEGATIQSAEGVGGGEAGVFVADKLFISTWLGGTLKFSNFITCLHRTVLEVNYLFHAGSARNYLFQKYSSPPPPPRLNGAPPPPLGGPLSRPNMFLSPISLICRWAHLPCIHLLIYNFLSKTDVGPSSENVGDADPALRLCCAQLLR